MIPVGHDPPAMLTDGERDRQTERIGKAKAQAKAQAKERFAMLNAFVDFTMGDLSKSEIIVWMILFRDTWEGIARTGQSDIARRGKMNRKTVGRSLRRLERRGLVTIVHQGGLYCGVSRYRVRALTHARPQ